MNLESTKLLCFALFIIMCIPVYFLGNKNEARIAKKKALLEAPDKTELNKNKIMDIVEASNYTYLLMIVIPTFALMMILYILLNDLPVSNLVLYNGYIVIALALIAFLTIRLVTNRHYRNVKKDLYEVETLKLKDIEEVDKKHFLVFKDLKVKINKKEKDNYEKGKEYLIITIKKHHVILDADKYYYVH